MLTKPLTLKGGELHLNVDAGRGYAVVAITDDIGTPLENLSLNKSLGISWMQKSNLTVHWRHSRKRKPTPISNQERKPIFPIGLLREGYNL